jgi:streptogrisin C
VSRTPIRVLLTAISAAAAGIAFTVPAQAGPVVTTLDRSTDAVVLAAAESSLADRLGDAFGNSWLDATTGKLTVGTTDASMVEAIRASGAVPRLVKHSAAQLDGVVTKLDKSLATRPASVTEWYVDAPTNSVVVSVLGGDPAGIAWARTAGTAVRVQHTNVAAKPLWNLIGGQALYLPGGGRCSIGFNARNSSGTRFVITAGHCVSSSGTFSGVGGSIGPGYATYFPGQDRGLVRVSSSSAVSTPYVSRYASGGNVIVAGASQAGVGAAVCRSGSTTGWRCGSIQARNTTVCYPQGCVSGLIRTNVCAEPGDSGGSLVTSGGSGARVQAQGMTSGGSGNCRTGGTTYFEPVTRALSGWGLTLYTG